MGAFSLAVLAQTWLEMLGPMVLISTACSGAVWPRSEPVSLVCDRWASWEGSDSIIPGLAAWERAS